MSEHENLDAMMQQLAGEAVAIARDLGVVLDRSAGSLAEVDRVLATLRAGLDSGENRPSDDEMAMMSKLWGAYLGEVLRGAAGGEWVLASPPNVQAPAPALNIQGALVFPTLKVYRRLTVGPGEEVVEFYRMVIARVGGERVQ